MAPTPEETFHDSRSGGPRSHYLKSVQAFSARGTRHTMNQQKSILSRRTAQFQAVARPCGLKPWAAAPGACRITCPPPCSGAGSERVILWTGAGREAAPGSILTGRIFPSLPKVSGPIPTPPLCKWASLLFEFAAAAERARSPRTPRAPAPCAGW